VITKRLVVGILERVESADRHLEAVERRARRVDAGMAETINQIRARDLLDAIRDLQYAAEIAE
jgi:hypothetical protein